MNWGHILGLAHNNAASEDFKQHPRGSDSTSVMDIGSPTLSGPLPYDVAAMDWVYRGKTPESSFHHCSDPQVLYVAGCDNADVAASRAISHKQMADAMLKVLQVDPHSFKRTINEADDGTFEALTTQLLSEFKNADLKWAFHFLEMADAYIGRSFINAHKVIALQKVPDRDAQEAWLRIFEFTLADSRADYSGSQRSFLEFAYTVIRDRPINLETIHEFVKNAEVRKL